MNHDDVKLLNAGRAHLVAGIGSQSIAVIFDLYFDMVSGALLSPAQALFERKDITS